MRWNLAPAPVLFFGFSADFEGLVREGGKTHSASQLCFYWSIQGRASGDHEKLFALTAKIKGRFMLTYDDTDEIRFLANKYALKYKTIPMKTTHHLQKNEIIISDNIDW
jgi:hypothetical protein